MRIQFLMVSLAVIVNAITATSASSTGTYPANISVSNGVAAPGAVVDFSGSGPQTREEDGCIVSVGTVPIVDASCAIGSDGSITGSFKLPADAPPGPVRIAACAPGCFDDLPPPTPDTTYWEATTTLIVAAVPASSDTPPPARSVPDLRQMSPAEAQSTAIAAGFTAVISETTPTGDLVISQAPAPGAAARADRTITVTLTVDNTRPGFVPDVVGFMKRDASRQLEVLKFTLVVQGIDYGNDAVVVSQTPLSGTPAQSGDSISVMLGPPDPPSTATASSGRDTPATSPPSTNAAASATSLPPTTPTGTPPPGPTGTGGTQLLEVGAATGSIALLTLILTGSRVVRTRRSPPLAAPARFDSTSIAA